MTEVLLRLGSLTGDQAYVKRAEAYLRLLQPAMASSPHGFGYLLGALDRWVARSTEIAVSGDP